MQQAHHSSPGARAADTTAFAIWLSQTLKSCHEDAVHEPIPVHLLELLPPPSSSRDN